MQRWVKALMLGALAILVIILYRQGHRPTEAIASAWYIDNALQDTGAPNAVAAIYLNYRMFDSLFETLMLLVSALAVIRLSWRSHESDQA
ncbi:MAG: hydrogen gas-evolving membrane-bound hydrogenase subunit E [Bacillota bacterium]|nr:hydrogen gas-evolving membrane-bound hydrogenase subunit E [Bacillota bacterium]